MTRRWLLLCCALAACDSATVPAQLNVYDFRLLTPAPKVMRWPAGTSVRVWVIEDAWLQTAADHSIVVWNRAVLYNEFKLEKVDDVSQADVVVVYSASQSPVNTTNCPPAGGNAFTTFCLSGSNLQVFPLQSGGASKVKFVVTVRSDVANNEAIVIRLLAHEIGHVLGLAQHSSSQTDLMYGGNLTRDDLSNADRATIQVLYHTRPDITP